MSAAVFWFLVGLMGWGGCVLEARARVVSGLPAVGNKSKRLEEKLQRWIKWLHCMKKIAPKMLAVTPAQANSASDTRRRYILMMSDTQYEAALAWSDQELKSREEQQLNAVKSKKSQSAPNRLSKAEDGGRGDADSENDGDGESENEAEDTDLLILEEIIPAPEEELKRIRSDVLVLRNRMFQCVGLPEVESLEYPLTSFDLEESQIAVLQGIDTPQKHLLLAIPPEERHKLITHAKLELKRINATKARQAKLLKAFPLNRRVFGSQQTDYAPKQRLKLPNVSSDSVVQRGPVANAPDVPPEW